MLTGFCKLFPNIKPEFPKDSNGNIIKTAISNPENLVNHYNLTKQKIDLIGAPLEYIESEIKNNLKIPVKINQPEQAKHEVKSSVLSRVRCQVFNWFKK